MSYTIAATEIKPGMTITEEHRGVKRTLTVDRVDHRVNYVATFSIEGGTVCIVNESPVTVEGEPPMSARAVGTILRVSGVGSIVKVRDTGHTQWVDADRGWRVLPGTVDAFRGVSVVYSPESEPDDEVAEVPDVVKRWEDWERDNTEWRKHKWKDNDGDMWEWLEDVGKWRVEDSYGVLRDLPGPSLFATFPVTLVK